MAMKDSVGSSNSDTRETRAAKRITVQVMNSLGMQRGGLTRTVLQRSRIVRPEDDLIFAVPSFQMDMVDLFTEMQRRSMIPERASLRSFHAEICRNGRKGEVAPSRVVQVATDIPGTDKTVEPNRRGQSERYFVAGKFIGLIQRDENQNIHFAIDHSDQAPWFPLQRTYYDSNGAARRRVFLDSEHRDRYQIFYNAEGGEYLASWLRQNGAAYRVVQFSATGAEQFDDIASAHAVWFEGLLNQLDDAMVLCDEPSTVFSLRNRTNNAQRVATFHASHLMPDAEANLKPKAWLRQYLNVKANIDRFVFLTNAQADDFAKTARIGGNQVAVIPHPSPPEAAPASGKREEGLLVSVGRLDRDKQIDHIIKAVVDARKHVSNLRLRVFGSGDQRDALQKLIVKLKAEDYISLEGYIADSQVAFANAEASVMTSLHEGFGLVILESLAAGTPVISYETPFGPRELINDGVNGLLIPLNDVAALSQALVQLFKKRKRLQKLQDAAKRSDGNFDEKDWANSWDELLHAEC